MKVLLITPPMTQINTPYPATAYLTQFLKDQDVVVDQKDLGLDFFHKIFSKNGLELIFDFISKKKKKTELELFFIDAYPDYVSTIELVKNFLQGNDSGLALRIANRKILPEGPRFSPVDDHEEIILNLFGEIGIQDKAKYFSSLYLDDLADIVKYSVDEHFEFSRYGESLASSKESFNDLHSALKKDSFLDSFLFSLVDDYIKNFSPELIGLTIPFPGNVYSALKTGKYIKEKYPHIKIVIGGGFVNTELRELEDARIFEFVDFMVFDDGEMPLKKLIQYLNGKCKEEELVRTWFLKSSKIVKIKNSGDINFKNINGPTYLGLDLKKYIPMLEMPNPVHRMWSDFRWNKMILAHGCYWKKCTFCDVSLDYINRFEPAKVDVLIDNIKRIINETNSTGFHFVDEAAPPALIKAMCERLIKENIKITWWGNLRFDKQFEHLAELMADSGCVAVTGGLEVASPRILDMINKGTTVEQVAKVTKAFTDHGILVHSYLMYGFPTQTVEETIDSLEVVRQLFENNCIQSAYWHRFMCTAHSPVGLNPEKFKIKLEKIKIPKEGLFAKNTIYYKDSTMPNLDILGEGLKKAVYNYMHGIGLKEDVRAWFDMTTPKTKIGKNFIKSAL